MRAHPRIKDIDARTGARSAAGKDECSRAQEMCTWPAGHAYQVSFRLLPVCLAVPTTFQAMLRLARALDWPSISPPVRAGHSEVEMLARRSQRLWCAIATIIASGCSKSESSV